MAQRTKQSPYFFQPCRSLCTPRVELAAGDIPHCAEDPCASILRLHSMHLMVITDCSRTTRKMPIAIDCGVCVQRTFLNLLVICECDHGIMQDDSFGGHLWVIGCFPLSSLGDRYVETPRGGFSTISNLLLECIADR